MLSLGLGLGLSSANLSRNHHDPLPALKSAILGKKIVAASYEGRALTFEPYALFKTEKETILAAVVLRADDEGLNRWEPQFFDVKKMKGETSLDQTFLPSAAFDPADLSDAVEIISSVEIV